MIFVYHCKVLVGPGGPTGFSEESQLLFSSKNMEILMFSLHLSLAESNGRDFFFKIQTDSRNVIVLRITGISIIFLGQNLDPICPCRLPWHFPI